MVLVEGGKRAAIKGRTRGFFTGAMEWYPGYFEGFRRLLVRTGGNKGSRFGHKKGVVRILRLPLEKGIKKRQKNPLHFRGSFALIV